MTFDAQDCIRRAAQARYVVRPLLRTWYRLRIMGAEEFPSAGPVVVAATHVGVLDPVLMLAACPRPVAVVARQDALVEPWGSALGRAGFLPAHYGAADWTAFAGARDVLASAESVVLFPEQMVGTGRAAAIDHTVALLALRSGATVVPAAIAGTRRAGMTVDAVPRRRSRLTVQFGESLTVEGRPSDRTDIAAAAELIRQRMADLARDAEFVAGVRLPPDPLLEAL